MLVAILMVSMALPDQTPKPEVPIVGRWVLKSATVNNTPTKPQDMKGYLKKSGGVKAGMVYKFEEPASDGDNDCSLNDIHGLYTYGQKTRSLNVGGGEDETRFELSFDSRIIGKDLELRFKENDNIVKLLFSPD